MGTLATKVPTNLTEIMQKFRPPSELHLGPRWETFFLKTLLISPLAEILYPPLNVTSANRVACFVLAMTHAHQVQLATACVVSL